MNLITKIVVLGSQLLALYAIVNGRFDVAAFVLAQASLMVLSETRA